MSTFDLNELHNFARIPFPNTNLDGKYHFFYDETNNIKKFVVREQGFNNGAYKNFVLGGVVYEGTRPDTSNIFKGIPRQANMTEIKFKHIASGNFLDCMKSSKLEQVLNNLYNTVLYIHFASLNILYFSIVDIVDSVLSVTGDISYEFHPDTYKNCLYDVLKLKIDKTIELFHKYQYPNIKENDTAAFIDDLKSILEPFTRRGLCGPFLMKLYGLLTRAKQAENLPFLYEEEDYILINGLHQNYLRPLYTFLESEHTFDEEADIITEFSHLKIVRNGSEYNQIKFIGSESDTLIQASDIIVGTFGKLYEYINLTNAKQIQHDLQTMNKQQQNTLDSLLKLFKKSLDKNDAFIYALKCDDEMFKMELILKQRGI